MSDTPASPQAKRLAAPGWLDGRLVLGVLLVLVSVVVGSRVLSAADRSQLVWAATGDLAAGSQLRASDLQPVRVRLFEQSSVYAGAAGGKKPVGYVLRRSLGKGEFLAQASVAAPGGELDFRAVTVPVEVGHFPPRLGAGQQVDVWLTPKLEGAVPAAGETGGAPAGDTPAGDAPPEQPPVDAVELRGAQQVLAKVTVLQGVTTADDFAAGTGSVPLVLQVRPADVSKLVSAMELGRLDVVRVPRGAEATGALRSAAAAS